MHARATIGFGFTSDWLQKWRENFEPITEWSNHKPKQFANYFRHSIEKHSNEQTTFHLLCSRVIARWFWRLFVNWHNSLHPGKIPTLSYPVRWMIDRLVQPSTPLSISESTFTALMRLRKISFNLRSKLFLFTKKSKWKNAFLSRQIRKLFLLKNGVGFSSNIFRCY